MASFTDQALIEAVLSILIPFFRIIGIFTSAPVISQRSTPARLRIGLALLIAMLVAPSVQTPAAALAGGLLVLIVHEVIIGLLIGFLARVIFAAFEIAGETIGLQMGLSFAGFFDPQSGASNPVSRLLNLLALTAFVTMNGHAILIRALIDSFEVVPINGGFSWLNAGVLSQAGLAMFELSLSIALPFIALILFLNLALGIMSRVAPQFSIFAIGFPVTIGCGLILLSLAVPMLDVPFSRALDLFADLMPAR